MIEHRLKAITNKLHSALDTLALQKAAAQSMLAALKMVLTGRAEPLTLREIDAVQRAVVQAEAAGIKTESPGNVISASSDLAKGDAP